MDRNPQRCPGLSALVASAGVAHADGPGRGNTAQFERSYLVFIINQHYSALRMTELAAGTDPMRDAQVVAPQEGTSPTPGLARLRPRPAMTKSDRWPAWATVYNVRKLAVPSAFYGNGTGSTTVPSLRPRDGE